VAAKKTAKRPASRRSTAFLRVGDASTYEGDNPWWTLRFAAPVSAPQQQALTAVFAGSELHLADRWENDRQVQLDADVACDSEGEWRAFYRRVDARLAKAHAACPLSVVFLQEGQFVTGQPLLALDDDELRAVVADAKREVSRPAPPPEPPPPPLSPVASVALNSAVTVEGTVEGLGKTRYVRKRDESIPVREGVLRDASGTLGVTFWDDDAREIEDGMRIRIENGWVGAHYNTQAPNLSRGKAGTLVRLS